MLSPLFGKFHRFWEGSGRREQREQENLENKDEFWEFLHELGGPIVGLTTIQKKLIHM